eukprot:762667-Hanusia_phi.AAC.4
MWARAEESEGAGERREERGERREERGERREERGERREERGERREERGERREERGERREERGERREERRERRERERREERGERRERERREERGEELSLRKTGSSTYGRWSSQRAREHRDGRKGNKRQRGPTSTTEKLSSMTMMTVTRDEAAMEKMGALVTDHRSEKSLGSSPDGADALPQRQRRPERLPSHLRRDLDVVAVDVLVVVVVHPRERHDGEGVVEDHKKEDGGEGPGEGLGGVLNFSRAGSG